MPFNYNNTSSFYVGCRNGPIVLVDIENGDYQIVWTSIGQYCEVPRIRASVTDSNEVFAIIAGFDSSNSKGGLILACEDSREFSQTWLSGVSLWAHLPCACGEHVMVGGFSEFSFILGQGIVAVVHAKEDRVTFVDGGIPLRNRNSSIWDINYASRFSSNDLIFMASESGVYLFSLD